MLTCPRCAATLKALRYGPKAVWGCADCGGCAAAFALLRDSIAHDRWKPLQRAVASAEAPSSRPCPSCRHPMLEAAAQGVAVETCRRCQLLGFDRGEAPEPRPREKPLSPEAAEALVRFQGREEEDEFAEMWQLMHLRQGLPVEIDSPSIANVPLATGALTLVLVVLGVLSASHPEWTSRFGFLPSAPLRDAGVTLFTYFFLHAGAWHLAGNAYFLVVFGDNVEEAAGRSGLLVLAFLGAAGGALLHALFDPYRIFPLIGASAGISALLAYYGLRFPKARIGWYLMNLPAWGFVLLWAGYQVLVAAAQFPGVTEVSAYAHLGGAAVGVAFWAVQRRMSPWTSTGRPRL
jgi:membrane associated rhomboid family serine protease